MRWKLFGKIKPDWPRCFLGNPFFFGGWRFRLNKFKITLQTVANESECWNYFSPQKQQPPKALKINLALFILIIQPVARQSALRFDCLSRKSFNEPELELSLSFALRTEQVAFSRKITPNWTRWTRPRLCLLANRKVLLM